MSCTQFHCIKMFILRHAWLNLWDKHMTTGRINQVTTNQMNRKDNYSAYRPIIKMNLLLPPRVSLPILLTHYFPIRRLVSVSYDSFNTDFNLVFAHPNWIFIKSCKEIRGTKNKTEREHRMGQRLKWSSKRSMMKLIVSNNR